MQEGTKADVMKNDFAAEDGSVSKDDISIDSLPQNINASLMPAMSDLEYSSLKSSIQEHGQSFPIVVNQDGVILDGHYRYKACHEPGIKPSVLVRQFENRLQEKKFIVVSNLNRRHPTDRIADQTRIDRV